MEEFVGQENRNLYEALTSYRYSVEWPCQCRNCGWEYDENLKRTISERVVKNPMIDFLRIVSDTLKETLTPSSKLRYCCINNFRPTIKRKAADTEEGEGGVKYHICTESIAVEEGLYEWYNVKWSIDDADTLKETEEELNEVSPVYPLNPCEHETDAKEFSLINYLQQTVI